MKLSRFTLALCLAASVGLTAPARQAQCQGGAAQPKLSARQSGSPSYQAAQNYDEYDCFYAGCHADYGDSLPRIESDESNVLLEGLPPEPTEGDFHLPGDNPAQRAIAPAANAGPAKSAEEGFVRGDRQIPSTIPPRGYFSPGYPHPGYLHPNYGYSHTEAGGAWFSNRGEEAGGGALTEQIATQEAALEEALLGASIAPAINAQSRAAVEASLADALVEEGFDAEDWMSIASAEQFDAEAWMLQASAELFDAQAWMAQASAEDFNADAWMAQASAELFDATAWMRQATAEAFDATAWMRQATAEAFDATAWMNEALVEEFDAEIWMANAEADEPLAVDEPSAADSLSEVASEEINQQYARYDDTYGFHSEWYGPYDATRIDATPHDTYDVAEVASPPADYTLSQRHAETASDELQEAVVDYGPAELEVDLTTVHASGYDDEDAADWEIAMRESRDDWFYRETYGYGPRYDYQQYGYEDFSTTATPVESHRSASPGLNERLSYPWDYVYRLELGNIDAEDHVVSTPIPMAPRRTPRASAEEFDLASLAAKKTEPSVPAGSDFDPSALVNGLGELAGRISAEAILAETAWWAKSITPIELARKALDSLPVAERGRITILIPQPKVIDIAAGQAETNSEDTLRELALLLDDVGRALQSLSRRVEALADATSPVSTIRSASPLPSRQPSDLETR